ncbi:MAG: hypothetical protein L6Q76_33025, partial [Polyangiaceae bacterium]|nr:hypothetical protein [Polyangiaceae bacterium]
MLAAAPLVWIAPGCGAEASNPSAGASDIIPAENETAALEVEALRSIFPDHASAILDQHSRFQPFADGHWIRVGLPAARGDAIDMRQGLGSWSGMDVLLPADASSPVRLVLTDGYEVRVREVGVEGRGLVAEGAVAYRRPGGTSYWTAAEGGVEEWLHLQPNAVSSDEPVAAWEVDGGSLRLRDDGQSALVFDENGAARVAVAAPLAFAASGRTVGVMLSVEGEKLLLFVDADNEEVLVDPSWSAAGPMATIRAAASSATLQDGRVFVVGGYNSGGQLNTAEVYDPAANTWSSASFIFGNRAGHSATRLNDGRVLVAGGYAGTTALASARLYNPATNTWVAAGTMLVGRTVH